MKFTDYIAEASKYDLQLYGIIQALKKNSMPFIKELRKSGQNELLWRGTTKNSTKSIIQVTPRQDRMPKDMPQEIHDELDDRFKRKFGWRPRSEGAFVTSKKSSADAYGQTYMFFPVGRCGYLYNPNIDDLYSYTDADSILYDAFIGSTSGDVSHFEDEWESEYGEDSGQGGTWHYLGADTGESYKEDALESAAETERIDYEEDRQRYENIENDLEWVPNVTLEDFIDEKREEAVSNADDTLKEIIEGYRKNNLGLAMKRKVEIMFLCKSYYLVDERFSKDIKKYLLEGKPMKFNPKQKGLPFYRDPDWRKGQQVKPDKGDPYKLKDYKSSGLGMMYGHPKYDKLSKKAKKGYQKGMPMPKKGYKLPNSLK